MSQTSVRIEGRDARQAYCHACGWEGVVGGPERAHAQAASHECDPADVEAYRREQQAEQVARGGDRKDTRGMPKKAGSGALEFTGRLANVSSKPPKESQVYTSGGYRKGLSGGGLTITIEIDRPELPSPPAKPYQLDRERPEDPGPQPEFEAPVQNEGESDKGYKSRIAQAKKAWEKEVETPWRLMLGEYQRYAEAEAKYAADMAKYQERSAAAGARFESFARLAGVGTLLQGMSVQGSLRPNPSQMKSFLPGFSPALALAGPAGVEPEVDADEADDEAADEDAD